MSGYKQHRSEFHQTFQTCATYDRISPGKLVISFCGLIPKFLFLFIIRMRVCLIMQNSQEYLANAFQATQERIESSLKVAPSRYLNTPANVISTVTRLFI